MQSYTLNMSYQRREVPTLYLMQQILYQLWISQIGFSRKKKSTSVSGNTGTVHCTLLS